jgi:nucleoside phosphorylase
MNRVTQLHQRAAIGIITALPKEFSAVKIMLQAPVDWLAPGEGAGRRYVLGEISAANAGTHAVVLALLTDVGTTSAAVNANNLLHHFPSVRHIIMCGIAGGIPSPTSPEDSVRLGDIVVSDRKGVVNYDFIKQTLDEIREIHPPPPPGAELLEAVRFLEATRIDGHRPWEKFLELSRNLEDAIRPRDNQGSDGMAIEYPHDPKRKPGLPRLFYSPIASANRLLKDARFRDELQRRFQVKAVEMEGSGIADATWLGGRAGYLVVRGICDFCDMRKGDHWQGYAAVAAAAYVRALLESMPALPLVSGTHAESTPRPNRDPSSAGRPPLSTSTTPNNTTSNQPQEAQAPSPSLAAPQATAQSVQAKRASPRRSRAPNRLGHAARW